MFMSSPTALESVIMSRADLYAWQDAEHLIKKIGADESSVAAWVVGRRDFDQIAADQVQALQATDDLEGLPGGETSDLGRAGAWREGRIEAVDIIGEIGRMIPYAAAHLVHQRGE